MEVRRGEIHWVEPVPGKGSEQRNNRPAVIVSNNQQNKTSSVIQVVYMTGKAKTNLPTHVTIESGPCVGSTVLCENVYSVSKERLQYPNSYIKPEWKRPHYGCEGQQNVNAHCSYRTENSGTVKEIC